MNLRLLSCVGFLLFSSGLSIVRAQTVLQPTELIQAANTASDLTNVGPFRLVATVVVRRGRSGQKSGELTILQDHERSRLELQWGDYKEVDVILGSKLYVVRNAPARPRELYGLPDVRKFWRVTLSSREKPGTTFTRDNQGMRANCFGVDVESRTYRLCFDPATNLLIERAWTEHKNPKGKPLLEVQYHDYREIGGHYYPGNISRFAQTQAYDAEDNFRLILNKEAPEVENIQVTPAKIAPSLFSVPENAREFETCDDMQLPRVTKREAPVYPPIARTAHWQGDVDIAAVIGKEGTLEDVRPLGSAQPVLIDAALEALKKWRFSPAMCGNQPVAVETTFRLEFHM